MPSQYQSAAGMQAEILCPPAATACEDAHRPELSEVNALQTGRGFVFPTIGRDADRRQSLASKCDSKGKPPHFVNLVKVRALLADSKVVERSCRVLAGHICDRHQG